MEKQQDVQSFLVVWRGQRLVIEMNLGASLKELGDKLQELTHVEADTLRLLVPVEKSSKLLYPFSDEHSRMSLESASILQGKSIRMMGVLKGEVDEVIQNAKVDLRIAGFDEEEKRLKQRISGRSYNSPKLPQGNYIFCDFRTLSLPGVELNPPASHALELLHKLASDPGIIAIMNKHRWRVGILTEMAPVGYVGVSPVCILGVNKNHGEEISLRLRTDDLKGFRKYGSIKKTLLHELAHMVFSKHNSDFYALDSQLNKEAATLDWTKSGGHTLSGGTSSEHYDEEFYPSSNVTASHKLGGRVSVLPTARAASANAAFARLADTSTSLSESSEVSDYRTLISSTGKFVQVPGPNIHEIQNELKPNPDNCEGEESMQLEPYTGSEQVHLEPAPLEQSNPNDSGVSPIEPNFNGDSDRRAAILEPNLHDDAEADPRDQNSELSDQMDVTPFTSILLPLEQSNPNDSGVSPIEPNFNGDFDRRVATLEPNLHDDADADPRDQNSELSDQMDDVTSSTSILLPPRSQSTEPDTDDPELRVIQDPVTVFCSRLQSAVQSLRNEAPPSEAERVLETLIKIIGNVMEYPNDVKFRRLGKANPIIKRNFVSYKAALEILKLIGFHEEDIVSEPGKADPYFILKRNDPGLLWLAKSSLEMLA